MLRLPFPDYLEEINSKVTEFLQTKNFEVDKMNHVLINEYQPGQGIMAHTDGPAYSPVVATISSGGGQILNIRKKENKEIIYSGIILVSYFLSHLSVYLEPGALSILHGALYNELHEIEENLSDDISRASNSRSLSTLLENGNFVIPRQTRISFTFRNVRSTRSLPKALLKTLNLDPGS